jgi:hypothetical protein
MTSRFAASSIATSFGISSPNSFRHISLNSCSAVSLTIRLHPFLSLPGGEFRKRRGKPGIRLRASLPLDSVPARVEPFTVSDGWRKRYQDLLPGKWSGSGASSRRSFPVFPVALVRRKPSSTLIWAALSPCLPPRQLVAIAFMFPRPLRCRAGIRVLVRLIRSGRYAYDLANRGSSQDGAKAVVLFGGTKKAPQ